jgi:hypothetical protein
MATREDLEKLSSKELHDRAMKVARHHLDVKFLWELMRMMPAAEAAAGNAQATDEDIAGSPGLFDVPLGMVEDLMRDDEGPLADALRPVYLDYLEAHTGHGHGEDQPAGQQQAQT